MPDNTTPSTATVEKPTVQAVVAERIQQSGPKVREIVIDAITSVEIGKRVETIAKAVKAQDELDKNLKKINRPDNTSYDGQGNKIETTSSSRYQEIQKAKEKLTNLTKALDAALDTNTAEAYTKLSEILNKVGGESKSESKKSDSAEVKTQA